MNHSQSANQNATNSEQDAKKIITHKEPTSTKTYHIECMETNSFIIEVEAQSEDEARELAHENVNSHEVIQEWVSDWEINLITEVK